MRGRHALVGGLLIGCCVLAGCTSQGGSAASGAAVDRAPVNGLAPVPNKAAAGGSAAGSGSSSSSGGNTKQAVSPPPNAGRDVIRSASVSLSASDIARTADQVRQITIAAGGYASSENTQNDQSDFTLAVPEPSLDSVVDRIAGLGKVVDRSEQAQDVTNQLVDVQSRVASQQASVTRVRALLSQATSISDIVSIEGELSSRESDLESLEQQQTELSGQVAMSTVTVHIGRSAAPPPAAAANTGGGFVGGLAAGWHSFVAVLGGVAVVLGALLPYLLGIGIPAALIWRFLRRRRGAAEAPTIGPDAG